MTHFTRLCKVPVRLIVLEMIIMSDKARNCGCRCAWLSAKIIWLFNNSSVLSFPSFPGNFFSSWPIVKSSDSLLTFGVALKNFINLPIVFILCTYLTFLRNQPVLAPVMQSNWIPTRWVQFSFSHVAISISLYFASLKYVHRRPANLHDGIWWWRNTFNWSWLLQSLNDISIRANWL